MPPGGFQNPDHSKYPDGAIQRLDHPPAYYIVVAAMSQPLARSLDVSTLGAARATGAIFLWLSLLAVYAIACAWGIGPVEVAIPLAAFVAALPTIFHASATVNNDIMVFTIGAWTLWFLIRNPHRYTADRPLFALALLAGLTRNTALIPMVAAAIILSIGAVRDGRSGRRMMKALAINLAVPATTLVVVRLWRPIAFSRAIPGFVNPIGTGNAVPVEGAPYNEILRTSLDLMPPTLPVWMHPSLRTEWTIGSDRLMTLVVVMSAGAALVAAIPLWRRTGWTLLMSASLAAPIVQLRAAFASEVSTAFTAVSQRYAIGLVPFAALLVVMLLDSRREIRWLRVPVCVVWILYAGVTYIVV